MESIKIIIILILALIIIVMLMYMRSKRKQLQSFTRQLRLLRTDNPGRPISIEHFDKDTVEMVNELQKYVDTEKELTRKAENDRQAVKMMVAGISHDFRTPLTAATGYLQMLQRDKELSDKNAEYVGNALDKMKYLGELSDEFFTLSLLENRKSEDIKEISLKKILEEVTLSQYEWISKRGLEFSADITEDECVIKAEELDIIRLFENLYSNAKKYTKGKINIKLNDNPRVSESEKYTIIFENDTDFLTEADTADVFKPFHRVSSGDTQGSGLGLYIAKIIVENYGGTISAEFDDKDIFRIIINI